MKTASTPLLAHQGGWDEILMVGLPLVVIAGLLVVANKRVSAKIAQAQAEEARNTVGETTEITETAASDEINPS